MKRLFEWLGGITLLLFSFYFTDRVSEIVINNTKLMGEIKTVMNEYQTSAVNAKVDISNNEIVPGKYGKKINEEESYQKMKDINAFNKNFLVFDYIKPQISLSDNKDKIISQGNTYNREVSLIVTDDTISKYLESNNIYYNSININKSLNTNVEYINANYEEKSFYETDKLLNKNNKICLKGYSNLNLCFDNDYYVVKPTIILNKQNIISSIDKIEAGYIILLDGNIDLRYINELIKEIKYRDFKIVFISSLIDEKSHA